MKKFYKGHGFDKYEAHLPVKNTFIHDDYYVSANQEKFHLATAYGYRDQGRGWSMGVQKKMFKASGSGWIVDQDGGATGKSDQ
jgi:hypothetical protein